MNRFYSISHNNAQNNEMPEVFEILMGLENLGMCKECGREQRYPSGDLSVVVRKQGLWPDLLACGDYPCFVVSGKFVHLLDESNIKLYIGGSVEVPQIKHKARAEMPSYYWIDGKKHIAAQMDFDSSGYVDIKVCSKCKNLSYDIAKTYRKQHENPSPPTKFNYDKSSGLDIFTTNLSPTMFFCTNKVLEIAAKSRLVNIRFSPVEEGVFGKSIEY